MHMKDIVLRLIVCFFVFAGIGADMALCQEWDMDFGQKWIWEYQTLPRAEYNPIRYYMGFTEKTFESGGKRYHEFRRLKEVKYYDFELSDSVVSDIFDPNPRFIRQEDGKTYVLTLAQSSVPVSYPENNDMSQFAESLIYDFTAEKGDILHLKLLPDESEIFPVTVSECNMIDIAGKKCKVLSFDELSYMTDYDSFKVIETIGVTFMGSLANYALTQLDGGHSALDESRSIYTILLRVFDENGKLIYRHHDFDQYDCRVEVKDVKDNDSESSYFNLQGLSVIVPASGGIYIRKSGGKFTKVKI